MITFCDTKSKAVLCNEKLFREITADPTHKLEKICTGVQQLKTQARQAASEGNETLAEQLREQAARLKQQLGAFVFQATFPSGHRCKKDAVGNGLVLLDIDDIEVVPQPEKAPAFCQKHGIVLLHVTPSGRGLRIVFKGDQRLSYVDNQHAMAERLGLKIDESCKDLSRMSYCVPQSHILYLDPELFTYDLPLPTESRQEKPIEQTSSPAEPIPLSYRGVSFDDIKAEWWRQHGGEPVVGERNTKIAQLAWHLRYLTDNDENLLYQVLPRFGLPDTEIRNICHQACEKPLFFKRSHQLEQVLTRVGIQTETQQSAQWMSCEENEYWHQRLATIDLPQGLRETLDSVGKREQVNALIATLPLAYTTATHISYRLWDAQWYRLSGTSILIGPASSGKSFLKPLVQAWTEPLRQADKAARAEENEYKMRREALNGSGSPGRRPQQSIRYLPSTASTSTIHERLENAKRLVWNVPRTQQFWQHEHLLTVELEFSTVVAALKRDFSSYADLIIKSHHDEESGVDYRSNDVTSGPHNVHWNQLFCGNVADFRRLLPNENVQNGLPLRQLIGFVADNRYQMNIPENFLSPLRRMKIVETAQMLDGLTGNVDIKPLSDSMCRWSEEKAHEMELAGDEIGDSIRRRCGSTIGMRAGVLSAVIRNAPNWHNLPVVVLNDEPGMPSEYKEYARQLTFCEDDFRLAELVADYSFEQIYKLFSEPLRQSSVQNERPAEGYIVRREREAEAKFAALPDAFTAEDVSRVFEVEPKTAKNKIYQWRSLGKIHRVKQNYYQKL